MWNSHYTFPFVPRVARADQLPFKITTMTGQPAARAGRLHLSKLSPREAAWIGEFAPVVAASRPPDRLVALGAQFIDESFDFVVGHAACTLAQV